jgi:regulator of protease activity HflC (stomatin/prohibitin superfamily)
VGQLIFAVLLALVAGIGVTVLIAAAKARQGQPQPGSALLPGVAVFVIVLVIFAILNSYTIVQAGSVAVVKRLGEVVSVFEPGLNWKIPFIDETIVYRTQDIVYETSDNPDNSSADYTDFEVDTATSDGQQISARYTVRFRIKPQEAANIVNNLGTEQEVVEKIVKQNSRVWVRTLLRNFSANQLYSGDIQGAQNEIASQLSSDFETEGLELVFFGLRQIGFTEAYKNAVELKQIEAENIITKQNLAEQAKFVKQRTITEAEAEAEKQRLERIGVAQGEAESTKLRAEADARATLVRAEAQAEANRLIAESLTAEVIGWQAVNQWNGRYPTVVSSGGGEQLILPTDLFLNAETP